MSLNEKIQYALSSSFFKSTNYAPTICEDCLFLKDKLAENNQYKSTIDNVGRDPYRLFLKKEQYHLLTPYSNWFSEVRHFFCDDCLSVFTEDFFKYTSEEKINNKDLFVSSYDFSAFLGLDTSLKIDVLTRLTLIYFEENFLQKLDKEAVYCYTIAPVNWGHPLDEINSISNETFDFFLNFIETNKLEHIYFDFDDVPNDCFSNTNELADFTIVRLKINQQNIKLNYHENYNPFEHTNNSFSFYIDKNDIHSVDYFDFLSNNWINSFDYQNLKKIAYSNSIAFEDNESFEFNYFSFNTFLRNLINENLNELF